MYDQTATTSGKATTDGNAVRYERDDGEPPSTAVARAIAAETDQDITEVPPLYEFVDTDALNALVTSPNGLEQSLRLSFAYDGLRVTVDGDGAILLRPV